MGQRWSDGGYSSEVSIRLEVADKTMRIAQIGPKSFILRDDCEFPPGTEGTIVITVDGHERKVHALLQNGVTSGVDEVDYIY